MNYQKLIIANLHKYCAIDLNKSNIQSLKTSNFFILNFDTYCGKLNTTYNISKDFLLIDLIKSSDIILIDDIFKNFKFKDIYQIIYNFSKDYKLLDIIKKVNVSKLYLFKFIDGDIEASLKFNFIINNIIVNVLFEKNKFKINYCKDSKIYYFNRDYKSFQDFLEFIIFKLYLKDEYKFKRFSKNNMNLIKLLRY